MVSGAPTSAIGFLLAGFLRLVRRAQQFLRTRRVTDTRMMSRFTLSRSTPPGAPVRFIWTDGGRHERGTRLDGGHIYNRSHASYEIPSNDETQSLTHRHLPTRTQVPHQAPCRRVRQVSQGRQGTGGRRQVQEGEIRRRLRRRCPPEEESAGGKSKKKVGVAAVIATLGATRRFLRTSICWSRSRSDCSARCFARCPARRASAAAARRWVRGERFSGVVPLAVRALSSKRSSIPPLAVRCLAQLSTMKLAAFDSSTERWLVVSWLFCANAIRPTSNWRRIASSSSTTC